MSIVCDPVVVGAHVGVDYNVCCNCGPFEGDQPDLDVAADYQART